MRILHAYCLNYNIGDYALGIGVKNLLREYLDVDLIAETNLQGQYFDEYYINEVVNKRYDLLVIGGGGIIHGAHWPNGWFWLIDQDLIKSIKIPFIVYGAGNNYFSNESIPERAVKHLEETARCAAFFSVRNDGSYDRVKAQINAEVSEVPDPGFHIALNTNYDRPTEEKYVIVQLANDKPDQRYKSPEAKQSLVDALRENVIDLAKKYKVILAPHVHDDVALSNEVAAGIDNCEVWDFSYFAFDHSPEAVAYYKYAEFVLAMRGHGQIVPIAFNVPVIAMHNHPKHAGLMKKLGLSEFAVDIASEDLKTQLADKIALVEKDRANIAAKLQQINQRLDNETKEAFGKLKQGLEA